MKLLLNEMWSSKIAEQLRRRGFDVVAATELPRRYRGVRDHEFFRRAQEDGRVVVTDNLRDFATLVAERASRAEPHCGVVFAVRPAFDLSHPAIVGDMTRALASLLSEGPKPGAVVFLRP